MDIEKLIERLSKYSEPVIAYKLDADFAASITDAISELRCKCDGCSVPATTAEMIRDLNDAPKLQAENEKLRAELENYRKGHCSEGGCAAEKDRDAVLAELEQVKAERDAAVEAVKNMAEYIVCAGRVDYFLCDEISQEHHLKYQPKNDGNYDNEPCYKCVADWFLQGHKWQESE